MQKYDNLDDLWCEWGSYVSPIMAFLDSNDPIVTGVKWSFEKGYADWHQNNTSVNILFRGFDPGQGEIVGITISSHSEDSDGQISVKHTPKRIISD